MVGSTKQERRDRDSPLMQPAPNGDGIAADAAIVTVTVSVTVQQLVQVNSPEDVLSGDAALVEGDDAGIAAADAQLFLGRPREDSLVLLAVSNESRHLGLP